MFNRDKIDVELDAKIDTLLVHMQAAPNAQQAAALAEQIAKIREAKSSSKTKPLDPNVLISAGSSLAGILLILHYEQASVVASKALGFIPKLR